MIITCILLRSGVFFEKGTWKEITLIIFNLRNIKKYF